MGDQVEKSWKFQGGGGSNAKPSGTENPVGWGVKLEKTLRWGGGGMDIFWDHAMQNFWGVKEVCYWIVQVVNC